MAEEKEIILSIKTDTSGAAGGIDELKGKLDGVNNTVLDKPFKTFKSEIKDAVNDAKRLEEQFGKNSKEFTNAAKRVAELKDRFGEFNQSIATFNPDNKLQALVSVARGATGAIQGVTGAMQFLGIQSGTAEEAIAKLQGLMAFSAALNSVDDIKNGFKNLGAVIQSTTIFQKANAAATTVTSVAMKGLGLSAEGTAVGFKVLKGAIVATGIGALVIGIVALIQNFDEVKKYIMNLIPGLGQVADFIGNIVNKITDFIGVTSEAGRATEKMIKDTEASIKASEEFLDANAYKYDEYTQRKIKANLDYKKHLVEISKDETKTEAEKQALLKQYRDKANYEINKASDDRAAKVKADLDKANDATKAAEAKKLKDEEDRKKKKEENDKKEIEGIKKFFDDKLAEINKGNEAEQIAYENQNAAAAQNTEDKLAAIEAAKALALQNATDKATVGTAGVVKAERENESEDGENPDEAKAKIQAILDAKLAEEDAIFQAKKLKAQGNNAELELIEQEHLTNDTNLKKEAAEANRLIDEAEHAAKVATVNAAGNLLAQGAALAGKHTVAGKAMAVASTTIQTYQSATSAFAGMTSSIPGPVGIALGVVAAAFAVATGVANIKKILAVKVPNAGGSGGSVPTPSAGAAPTILAAATAQQAIQNVRVTNNPNQQPIRAYITNSDLQSNEQKNKFLNNVSTF